MNRLTRFCVSVAAITAAAGLSPVSAQTEPTSTLTSAPPPRVLPLDMTRTTGQPRSDVFRFCVGGDRAIIYERPTVQRDLQFVRDHCGFQYIRFHGLLNQEMKVVAAAGSATAAPRYDWKNIDAVYDTLLKIGIKPFVELGFMPEPLASGKQTIFYYHGNTTPPRSYEVWGSFITALTQHLTDRYTADEVKSWYFEVWNEPNLTGFWHGSQADYFHLYDVTSRAIKSVNPAYRVGGPATAGLAWIPAFLQNAHDQGSPVDFVSSHTYGVNQGFLDATGKTQTVLDPSPNAIVGALPGVVESIRRSPSPNLPLFITEWSTSYSARDPVHDSYLSAAYILSRLNRVPAGVAGMSYWTFSDQFEENGPVPSPFHGGFGLLNAQGLLKPAYFAYQFLNELGPTRLTSDDPDTLATTDPAGNLKLLLWNYTPPKQDRPNATFYTRDWAAAPAPSIDLHVQHVTPGEYTLNLYRVGYRHNDVYTAYVDLGKPPGLPNDPGLLPDPAYQKLKAACTGAPEMSTPIHVDADGLWSLHLPVNQNDVYFVTLTH